MYDDGILTGLTNWHRVCESDSVIFWDFTYSFIPCSISDLAMETEEDPAERLKRLNAKISSRANETKAKAAFSSVTNLTATNFRSKKTTLGTNGSSLSRSSSNSTEGRDEGYREENVLPSINMRTSFSPSRRQTQEHAQTGLSTGGIPNRANPSLPPQTSRRPRASSRNRAVPIVRDHLDVTESSFSPDTSTVHIEPMETIPPPDCSDIDHEDEFDLKHNDDAFESVATMVCDQVLPKVQSGENTYSLDKDDLNYMDEVVPESVRKVFVNALRFRAQRLPQVASGGELGLIGITRECVRLGLARVEEDNFLLGGGTKLVNGSVQMKVR